MKPHKCSTPSVQLLQCSARRVRKLVRILGPAWGLALAVASIGCAHTEVSDDKSAQENEVLRERVRHLERRVSDLDAQLTLLTDKMETPSRPAIAPERTLDRTRATDLAPTSIPAEITHEGDRVEKIGLGMESIDLAPKPRPTASRTPQTQAELWSAPAADVGTMSDAEAMAVLEAEAAARRSTPREADGPPSAGVNALYDWALARLNAGDYLPAIAAFEDVMERYSEHHLADNALYWTAVAHARGGNPRLAIEVFQSLPMRFPKSPKRADALFETALAYESVGEPKLAQAFYGQMLSQFPQAERRQDARRALARLR